MQKRIQTLISLSFSLVISFAFSMAEGAFTAPDMNFIHYTTENGMPSNHVRDIVQDNEGFIWFATDGGLVRFDGVSFKVFVPGLPQSRDVFVMSLCKMGNGILAGTDHGLYRYDPEQESVVKVPIAERMKWKEERGVIDIAIDSQGDIWVSMEGYGLFRLNSRLEPVAHYDFPEVDNYVGSVYVDVNDMVWCATTGNKGCLFRYDRSKSSFLPFEIRVEGKKINTSSMAVNFDLHGEYWLGTWENGLVRFNGRTGEGERLGGIPASALWHIHSITEYSPTQILVGSDSGLTLVDTSTGEYHVYQSDELNPQSLTDRFIYPIFKDREGGLWIGTYYRGANYLSRESRRFRRWNHSRFANSVSGNVVTRFCEDHRGNIWIGTADGGLSCYDPGANTFRHVPLGPGGGNEDINALFADGDRIWVGTYYRGAGTIDIATGKWTPVSVEGNHDYSSYAIYRDRNGDVWMASVGTLTRYNGGSRLFEKIDDFGAWITDIDEDRDGNLWLSTQGNGLYRVNPATGEKKRYVRSQSSGSLPINHINCVKVDGNGTVYVGTVFGLYEYESGTDSFKVVSETLTDVDVKSIEKNGDDIWLSSQTGLMQLIPEGEVRNFTYQDGICDNQFSSGASLHASDGRIYFGSVHGFCHVDPVEVRNITIPPMMKFTGLDIVNNPVSPGSEKLPKSLNHIPQLVLTHNDHTFTLYFSALSYSNPHGISYKYKLDGFDKTWRNTGRDNRVTYSNLPAGKYTLRVKAVSGEGVWNDDELTLKIVVRPAWYLSAIMKTFYVLAGVALLLVGLRYILRRMEREHIVELDRISSNKEKEMIRSKLKFFTVVAHEIRTPVSLIIGPLEKIMDSRESFTPSVKEDLKVIDRNAHRLLSLVNQLLDYKKVEDNALQVGYRKTRICPLIESVTERFIPSLEQKGVRLTVSCPGDEVTADVDPEAVTKLVSNLLNNARKFTKSEIRVNCRVTEDGEKIVIRVEDDGIGITKENRDKIFKPFFQVLDNVNEARGGTGLGLSIVKSVVDGHGGTIEVDSAPGKGSSFIVTLPVHQEKVMPGEDAGVNDFEPVSDGHKDDPVDNNVERKPVVLVVDDNEDMVKFISSNLEHGYDVVTAFNGREAIEKMDGSNISLIICDWMMPVMDGMAFLKHIRESELYSHIPFIMLTARTDNVSKVETMKGGADLYMEKPFSISYLEAGVNNLLEMRAMLRKKFSESPEEPITTLASSNVESEFLVRLQNLIEENFSNPGLNVDFIADHMGVSRSGLYAKIKTLVDVTPNELIQLTRLKRAAVLLKEGKYRINEISYMVGFNSSSYFARCFQKQFGMTPGEYAGR